MIRHENKIIKLIAFGPLLFIPLFVLIVIMFIIYENRINLDKTIENLEVDLIFSKKEAIRSKIDGISDLVAYQNNIIEKKLTSRVKDRVITAYKISNKLYEKYHKTKSEKEIKNLIVETLRPLVWNDGESFIWILNYKGEFQLAPEYLRHLEGTSIIDFKDATGRYVIKEEIQIVQEQNEGFLWDTFTKPSNPQKHYKQVAFVKDFGHFDWYMGSGEYLDTASKISNQEVLKSIEKIRDDRNGYVFVLTNQGEMILNYARPELIGKNVLEKLNPYHKIFTRVFWELNNSEYTFITYDWQNPQSKKIEKKYGYIKKIPQTNWILGSGFYESDIKDDAAKQAKQLYEDYDVRIKYIISIGVVTLIIAFLLSIVISRYLKRTFLAYKKGIEDKTNELKALNETLEDKVALRTKELEDSKHSLEILATTDVLTKVNNRYSIMTRLEDEVHRQKRHNLPLCVMMFDIDHFKEVNDQYGHDTGDEILKAVVDVVRNNLRDIDIIGRYGGEEFLVIYPNTKLDNAIKVSERIRENVQDNKFDKVENITISLGIVQCENESTVELFKRLDKLLYKAKNNGRNQLSF